MKRICGIFIFITLLPLVVCTSPHHSFAAEYDANKPITLLYMNVKDANGNLVNWAIEMGPPNGLIRRGVHRDSVPVGLEVTVEGYRAKDGTPTANCTTILLPDGRQLFAAFSAPVAHGAEHRITP